MNSYLRAMLGEKTPFINYSAFAYHHYSHEILRNDFFSSCPFSQTITCKVEKQVRRVIEKYFWIFAEFAVRFPQTHALLDIPAHGTPRIPRACRAI